MTEQRLYNPALLSDEELQKSFVVRQRQFDELIGLIKSEPKSGALQHILIIGPRGMGKTTLGLRTLLAIREDSRLSKLWQPVPFFEESYGITDLAGLWLTALGHLSDATKDSQWRKIADQLNSEEKNSERLAAGALNALIDFHKETGRRLILFVENLDEVISQFLDAHDKSRLRAVLQERSEILIIGTANSVFEEITSHGEPFYEFFRQIRLSGLNQEETLVFMREIARQQSNDALASVVKTDPGRIEAIRQRTDGNPRIINLTARMLAESPNGKARDDLERLIDEQTPYFKARIERLSPQLRAVFHTLAAGWRPMLAREAAEALRISSSQASAQLKKLENLGYVESMKPSGSRRLHYQLRERFYNIYYVLRFTRDQKRRLERLIDFIAHLFGPIAISGMAQATLARLSHGGASLSEEWATMAALAPRLASDDGLADKNKLFEQALRLCVEQEIDAPEILLHGIEEIEGEESIDDYIKVAINHLNNDPEDIGILFRIVTAYNKRYLLSNSYEDISKSIEYVEKISSIKPNYNIWCSIGLRYLAIRKLKRSEEAFQKSLHYNSKYSTAWIGLSAISFLNKDLKNSEKSISKAMKYLPDDSNNLSMMSSILIGLNRFNDACDVLCNVVEKSPRVALAWLSLSTVFVKTGQFEDGLNAANKAIDCDPKHPEMRTQKAVILSELNKNREAEEEFRSAIKIKPNSAMINSTFGSFLDSNDRHQEAEKFYRKATELDSTLLTAWTSLALVLYRLDRLDEAEEVLHKVISLDPNSALARFTLIAIFVSRDDWKSVLEQIGFVANPDNETWLSQNASSITNILILAVAKGNLKKVSEILENDPLKELLEPLFHAVNLELGISPLSALPDEIMKAITEVQKRISAVRGTRSDFKVELKVVSPATFSN